MKLIEIKKDAKKRTVNLNEGAAMEEFFTKEEFQKFLRGDVPRKPNGGYTYPAEVTFYYYDYHVRLFREEVEKRLGLRPLLRYIKKLSKGDRGALSKQLYPYYQKVAISQLKPLLNAVYKPFSRTDISDLNNRQYHVSDVVVHYGKKEYRGFDIDEILSDIGTDHLRRCIAILREKEYITISNTTQDRFLRGWRYTYSFTYYKLTEKGEQLVAKLERGGR